MTKDKDDRKRPSLRLVVSNPDKRGVRPKKEKEEDVFVPLAELEANRDAIRPGFYRGLERAQSRAYQRLEAYLSDHNLPYGLDPHHGTVIVVPTAAVCPVSAEHGGAQQDELLLFVSEDPTGKGHCLSLETILPYWSDDESVMEEALLYSPINQYGALFLEENRHDGLLDLVYRLALPVYPPAPTRRILDRFFAIAALELADILQSLAGE